MTPKIPRKVNPRTGGSSSCLSGLLATLILTFFLPTTPLLQPDSGAGAGGVASETGGKTNSSGVEKEVQDENEPEYDKAYLEQKTKQIDRLLEKRRFGRAYEQAQSLRRNIEETVFKMEAAEYFHGVLRSVREVFERVRDEARRYRKVGRHKLSMTFWHHVKHVKQAGFRVSDAPIGTGWITNRLADFLRSKFNAMNLFVELNAQAKSPARKLTLNEVQSIGRHLLTSTVTFLYAKKARPLLESIREERNRRRKLVRRYEPFMQEFDGAENPFEREGWMRVMPVYEKRYWDWKQMDDPDWTPNCDTWFETLYAEYDVKPGKIPNMD